MDGAERGLFEQAVRRAVATQGGPALDLALEELGWRDALWAEPRTAVGVLFEAQGAACTTSSAFDHVLADALGIGAATSAVVLPALGRWHPPTDAAESRRVFGLGTSAFGRADSATVVVNDGGARVAVQVAPPALSFRAVEGMDPSLGLSVVAGEVPDDGEAIELVPGAWARAVALARLALAHELVGASSTMLDLARTHSLDRVQFGRPIVTFQAVRHRLADTLVAVEGARALLDAAWDAPSVEAAAMAKAVAGRTARLASRHCQQVLAGIGFTTEHPLHRYVRRVLVLDQLFGSAGVLTRDFGRRLAAGEPLPPPIAL